MEQANTCPLIPSSTHRSARLAEVRLLDTGTKVIGKQLMRAHKGHTGHSTFRRAVLKCVFTYG